MSVIRTLSSSESNEEREKEKAKLEREYKRTDQQLNELVSHHNKDLTQVMQVTEIYIDCLPIIKYYQLLEDTITVSNLQEV